MSIRIAAGFEPMNPTIRLHGCHRVGNRITGLDPAAPGSDRTIFIEGLPLSEGWVAHMFLIDKREAFYDWNKLT